ncbi:MAG: hypothetical protein WC458_01865 [Patescibacteria group bacterium]
MLKLKINLKDGLIEVEGDDAFVKQVYSDYKSKLNDTKIPTAGPNPENPKISKRKRGSVTKGKRKESYTKLENLNLSSDVEEETLKHFYNKKKPQSALHTNVVFVYFLEKNKKISNITPDHIYTCYKHIGIKVPQAFKQSIFDTSSRGFIDTSSIENIKITTNGENLVEIDMPISKDKK